MRKYYRHSVAAVAVTLLILSLRHLAHGIGQVTGVSELESMLMAIGIDCAMVACELALIAGIRTKWTHGIIVATCLLSAGFNILGFLEHAQGALGQYLAVTLGVFVPAAVYGLTDTVTQRPRSKAKAKARTATIRKLRAIQ